MTNSERPMDDPDGMPDEIADEHPDRVDDMVERVTGSGWLSFAGILILLIGVFKFVDGIWALANKHYRSDLSGATYVFNLTGWGWIHLLLGAVLIATGIGVLGGQEVGPGGRHRAGRRDGDPPTALSAVLHRLADQHPALRTRDLRADRAEEGCGRRLLAATAPRA
jgi:hypothetical protein